MSDIEQSMVWSVVWLLGQAASLLYLGTHLLGFVAEIIALSVQSNNSNNNMIFLSGPQCVDPVAALGHTFVVFRDRFDLGASLRITAGLLTSEDDVIVLMSPSSDLGSSSPVSARTRFCRWPDSCPLLCCFLVRVDQFIRLRGVSGS
ncbi:hypothetical protein GGR54DRAFT_599527 [Hypoxylon sp. NC1633]|nr:hypothetical protein GGR54DRAFT_599527 [Hypoxylon sp. NC1633]